LLLKTPSDGSSSRLCGNFAFDSPGTNGFSPVTTRERKPEPGNYFRPAVTIALVGMTQPP
jgi:hypothetical protein